MIENESFHCQTLAMSSKKWSSNGWTNLLPKFDKAKLDAKFGTRNGFAKHAKSSPMFGSSIHFDPTVDNE